MRISCIQKKKKKREAAYNHRVLCTPCVLPQFLTIEEMPRLVKCVGGNKDVSELCTPVCICTVCIREVLLFSR